MREKRIALAVCLVLLLISSVWLIRFPCRHLHWIPRC